MKTAHLTKIKSFLEKQKDKIFLPIGEKTADSTKSKAVAMNIMKILPNLLKKTQNEEQKVADYIALENKPQTSLFIPTKKILSDTQTVVKLPEMDKQKLFYMAKTGQIKNKLEKIGEEGHVLTIPAYQAGKNVIKGLKRITAAASTAAQPSTAPLPKRVLDRVEQEAGNAAIKDVNRNLLVAKADAMVNASKGDSSKQINATLS